MFVQAKPQQMDQNRCDKNTSESRSSSFPTNVANKKCQRNRNSLVQIKITIFNLEEASYKKVGNFMKKIFPAVEFRSVIPKPLKLSDIQYKYEKTTH